MEVRTLLRRDGDQWRCWEVTWEGCDVELAEGPLGAGERDQGDEAELFTRRFATPLEATEYVEEQLALRRAEGWDERLAQPEPHQPPARAAADPELEALIDAHPEDPEPYLVYADWLQAHSDPRGELITLQHALAREPTDALQAAEAALLEDHREHFLGGLADLFEHTELSWRLGFIHRARLFVRGTRKLGLDDESLLLAFLRHGSARFLRQLVVHRTPAEIWEARNHDGLVQALLQAGPRPALRRLQLGHPDQDGVFNVPAALWPTLPALEELCLFGGSLELEPPAAPCGVQTLVIGAWISAEDLAALAAATWPRLERLHLIFNDHDPEQIVELLAALSRGAPALRHLGLCKYVQSEALALALLDQQKLLGRLVTLDLTGGHLSDATLVRLRGAAAVEVLTDADQEAAYRPGWPKGEELDDDYYDDDDDGEGDGDYYDDDDDDGEAQIYGYAEEGQAYAPEQPSKERGVDEGWEELDRENPYDLDDA